MSFDARLLRSTLGLFATGVTVIATGADDDVHAMTANAFTSLSLDPPLVLFCPGKKARMVKLLEQMRRFSINILREDQDALSRFFAGMWQGAEPPEFRFSAWEGSPRLEGCVAAFVCQLEHLLDGGDHWIVVGRVLSVYQGPAPRCPLVFYAGKYHQLASAVVEVPASELVFHDPWG